MTYHRQDVSLCMSLLAVLVALVSVGALQADEQQFETVTKGQRTAAKRAVEAKDERHRSAAQQRAKLEWELNSLMGRVTQNHPRVKQLEAQMRALSDATDRDPKGQRERAPMQHAQEAVKQLHAAGLHDLAEMIGDQVRERLHDRDRDDRPRPDREQHQREQREAHEQDSDPHDDIRHVIDRLGQAIRNIEQRVRDSNEIQRAVEDAHRNLRLMQREFELRFREIEQAMKHRVRDTERLIGDHSGEFEEAIENMERHVDDRIGELEERLDDLYEYFDEDEDEDEDE